MVLRLDMVVTTFLRCSSVLTQNKLVFCCDPLESLFAAFDAILKLRAARRQQCENFIGRAIDARKSEPWREFYLLPDPVAVFAVVSVYSLS